MSEGMSSRPLRFPPSLAAITTVLAIAYVALYFRHLSGPQNTMARLGLIASSIVTGGMVSLGVLVARGFASQLNGLEATDPRFAALYLMTLLHVVQITIMVWIIDDAISDTFFER